MKLGLLLLSVLLLYNVALYSREPFGVNREHDLRDLGRVLPLAEQGIADAECLAGLIYAKGLKRYDRGYLWTKKASEHDVKECHALLGIMYFNGLGVVQDYELAFAAFKKGERLRDKLSMANMGAMLLKGLATQRNTTKGLQLLEQAAIGGSKYIKIGLANILFDCRYGVQCAYHKGVEHMESAAEDGSVSAMLHLGYIYELGENGIPVDRVRAMNYFARAANKGSNEAKRALAILRGRVQNRFN